MAAHFLYVTRDFRSELALRFLSIASITRSSSTQQQNDITWQKESLSNIEQNPLDLSISINPLHCFLQGKIVGLIFRHESFV